MTRSDALFTLMVNLLIKESRYGTCNTKKFTFLCYLCNHVNLKITPSETNSEI